MKIPAKAVVVSPKDNVATAINDVKAGEDVLIIGLDKKYYVRVKDDIPFGHKFAIREIKAGEDIVKYGEAIGRAVSNIGIGEHVHIHNIVSLRV